MSDSVLLTPEQRERLQNLKAAWEEGEGEERFAALRLREQDLETLRSVKTLLETRGIWNYDGTRRFLALVRSLAPNPNLDARLLRSPGEPNQFQTDLRELLYGELPLTSRLTEFIARRHAGGRTALQLLCVSAAAEFPLITAQSWKSLNPSESQLRDALKTVTRRHFPDLTPDAPVTGSDESLNTLAQAELFRLAKAETDADDYLSLHRMLTWEGGAKRSRRRVIYTPSLTNSAQTQSIAEETPRYNHLVAELSSNSDIPVSPPDLSKISSALVLAEIETEIAAKGFTYAPLTIRSYYLSLQSKPFVLLSGLSGTGKSRLTSLFAEAMTGHNSQYLSLPVRPDWHDSAPVLGYVNYLAGGGAGRYVPTPFLDFVALAAQSDTNRNAYFLLFDELNLARVEYYLAEILSAMETESGELLLPNGQKFPLPPNLFLSGTLNLDEGTHTLSRKTLDRANVISFASVAVPFGEVTPGTLLKSKTTSEQRQTVFLGSRVKSVAQARARLGGVGGKSLDAEKWLTGSLTEINTILERGGANFGYRVRDEIFRFCAHSFDLNGVPLLIGSDPKTPKDAKSNLQTALDLQLMQKILPRLSGTREQLETTLKDLHQWTAKNSCPRTAERLERMKRKLERAGFLLME